MATYDDPRVVDSPQPATNLKEFVAARLAVKSHRSKLHVSRAESKRVKVRVVAGVEGVFHDRRHRLNCIAS